MNFIDRFKAGWNAAQLQPPPLPRAPNKPVSTPSHRTQATPQATAVRRTVRNLADTPRTAARTGANAYAITRELAEASPDLSSAVSTLLRTGIPEKFTIVGRNLDGQVDRPATELAHELLRRITFLGAADGSYGAQMSIQSLSESLGKELIYYGAAAVEVALDKARVPASLNPVSVTKLKAYDEDESVRWVQEVGGVEIDLDIPTFVYVAADQLLTEAYSSGFIQAATQPTLADAEFSDDLRRVLKRSVHPRVNVTIDSEKIRKNTSPEVLHDPEKFAAHQTSILTAVQEMVNGLAPEDALVSFDSVSYDLLGADNDAATIIEKIQKVLNGKLAAGAKTLPVVLGHGGSSNSSSTESLLYIKTANMLRLKLNEIYSRALTVAIRIMGIDGYVEFRYADIELRPESELAAFRSMQTSNTLQLLSLGFITDDEAALQLTGHLTPAGFTPLAGTGFFSSNAAGSQINTENPTSNTSAVERTLKPKTPTAPKT